LPGRNTGISKSSIADEQVEIQTEYSPNISNYFFLIGIVGGGVTPPTRRPTVPAPGDYMDGEYGGMMIAWETEVLGENLAPVSFCPSQIPHDLTGRGGKPATNRLSYGTAKYK
jgi:hypothetical protein